MPEPKKTEHPSYPREAVREGIQGSVIMRVIVNADGGTGDILLGQSLRHDLDMAAVGAMKQWRFKPATHNGQPIAVAVFVEMSFHLP